MRKLFTILCVLGLISMISCDDPNVDELYNVDGTIQVTVGDDTGTGEDDDPRGGS